MFVSNHFAIISFVPFTQLPKILTRLGTCVIKQLNDDLGVVQSKMVMELQEHIGPRIRVVNEIDHHALSLILVFIVPFLINIPESHFCPIEEFFAISDQQALVVINDVSMRVVIVVLTLKRQLVKRPFERQL